ncbi:JAB domain-containing protein [Bacteroidales bacterium OttesenSCG-928-B11]|nr:JAB domain-containing protein [Bacteroidales bacterium OttesenSCG-928-C03]MDL2313206.1 JAB domain-containing protein [Bacteroidales bacterium OttesenSCG-928-B11]MDL2326130.1 JAB domain-containing protein [Bacteroidales bacterium OttesenSCG-928-A14]
MEKLKTPVVPLVKIHYQSKVKPSERKQIRTAQDVYDIMLAEEEMAQNIDYKELAFAIYLNQSSKVLSVMKLAEGGITSTEVDIRIALQGALLLNATSLIFIHNHPGGEVSPSPSDIQLTNNFKDAARLLNIRLVDHLIISSENYFSFVQKGMLE